MEVTVTVQVAVLLPSAVVTVIVADPTAMAVIVTVPAEVWLDRLTVATPVLLLVQVTSLTGALAGAMVAVSVPVAPLLRFKVVLLRVTPVTIPGAVLVSEFHLT